MHRARPLLLAGAAAALLAGCATSGGTPAPTWVPSPQVGGRGEGPGAQVSPIVPEPSLPGVAPGGGGGGSAGPAPSSGASSSPAKRLDPLVVATRLRAPVGLILMPDGTALVGERTTGRIVRVQPRAGRPVPTVRVLRGLDAGGDGGLLDLALSPTYGEDGLIYAYITTSTDNRVVDFTLHGPTTPVVTGIPKGTTGNTGRILFGGDGNLYIGTGDAGQPALAADPRSLAGKVLRVNDIGDPAVGNPVAASLIYTSGHRIVNGLCGVPRSKYVLEVEAGGPDKIDLLQRGGFYGWPVSSKRERIAPLFTLPVQYTGPGGCAVLAGRLWITSLNGQALVSTALSGIGVPPGTSRWAPVLAKRYGRLKTVVAADDGALWLTTSNRDGHGKAVAADERVIRYVPSASVGRSPL
jgi:glucose/arabinose dehydrogenase